MSVITSTSGCLHGEFVCLLFLQTHWETDRFLTTLGVHLAQTNFHFHHVVFSSQFKSKVGHILTKTVSLRINLNIDGTPISFGSHTHPPHSQNSRLLTSSLSLGCSGSPWSPVYVRRVDPSVLAFSLSFHRHLHICTPFNSHFISCS